MGLFANIINIEGGNFDLFSQSIVVDANNGTLVLVDLLLIAIGRFSNLALEEAILDTGKHATQRIDTVAGSPWRPARSASVRASIK